MHRHTEIEDAIAIALKPNRDRPCYAILIAKRDDDDRIAAPIAIV